MLILYLLRLCLISFSFEFTVLEIVKAPGNVLQQKFIKLGTLQGKTLNEIQSACGAPSSVSYGADGVKIYQWMATGYHIVLLFDENDICLGVNSETKV